MKRASALVAALVAVMSQASLPNVASGQHGSPHRSDGQAARRLLVTLDVRDGVDAAPYRVTVPTERQDATGRLPLSAWSCAYTWHRSSPPRGLEDYVPFEDTLSVRCMAGQQGAEFHLRCPDVGAADPMVSNLFVLVRIGHDGREVRTVITATCLDRSPPPDEPSQ